MSFEHGWAAVHLDMPPRVPRTEHSADVYHFDLVRAVTGIDVGPGSNEDLKARAARAFREAWNYDILFGAAAHYGVLKGLHTDMDHAEYAVE